MAGVPSRIPHVKADLEELFRNSPDLDGVLVSRATAGRNRESDELVVGTARFTHEPASLGRGMRVLRERFDVILTISSVKRGDRFTEAEERMWELVAAVEGVLADNHRAGGVIFELVAEGQQSFALVDKGVASEATLTVRGSARITQED